MKEPVHTAANPPARAKSPRVEFAFGLEPIVQLTAGLSVAGKVDFIGATSDFLVTTRRVPD
jgi:hypothetical protein